MMPRARILIVEDEPSVARALSSFISRRGYEPVAAARFEEALPVLMGDPAPDAVLTDLRLDNSKALLGLVVVTLARSRSESLPILVLSANVNGGGGDAALALGADRLLEKPIPLEDVFDALEDVLSERGVTEDGYPPARVGQNRG